MFQTLYANSQGGASLEFFAATKGRECNIQDARGKGLWFANLINIVSLVMEPRTQVIIKHYFFSSFYFFFLQNICYVRTTNEVPCFQSDYGEKNITPC